MTAQSRKQYRKSVRIAPEILLFEQISTKSQHYHNNWVVHPDEFNSEIWATLQQ